MEVLLMRSLGDEDDLGAVNCDSYVDDRDKTTT